MSLDSHGSSFNFSIELNPEQKKVLTGHPSEKLGQKEDLENFQGFSKAEGNSIEDKKTAFLYAMWEFSNSPQFKALTYGLEDHFQIEVKHTINLSMPR